MPRFYFDVCDGGLPFPDQVGLELASKHAAREVAMSILSQICIKPADGEDEHRISVVVRDEDGGAVLRARLRLACDWCG